MISSHSSYSKYMAYNFYEIKSKYLTKYQKGEATAETFLN